MKDKIAHKSIENFKKGMDELSMQCLEDFDKLAS